MFLMRTMVPFECLWVQDFETVDNGRYHNFVTGRGLLFSADVHSPVTQFNILFDVSTRTNQGLKILTSRGRFFI